MSDTMEDLLNIEVARRLWIELGDIPVNDDGELEQEFNATFDGDTVTFEVGTDREHIWHWFEFIFNLSVAEDLMYVNGKN